MHRFKTLITLVISFIPMLVFASSNPEIDNLAHKFMQENKVQGLSIAVINGKSIKTFNYGYANELTKIPTTDKTIYRIASFSKTYTATLGSIAAVENKINLNTPAINYIPELKNADNLSDITTQMLLAHVAGFPFNFIPIPEDYKQATLDLKSYRPPYKPGTQYSYSNISIGLVAYILQNSYHQKYDTLLKDKISIPLKLTSTYLNLPSTQEKYVALGHDGEKLRPYDRNIDVWFAASSLKSNISDMSKFLNAQINYTALQDKSLASAISLAHQDKYCFANGIACEQLGWQAHNISEINTDTGDTFFKGFNKNNQPTFDQQIIVNRNTLLNKNVFIDKTCSGYGMSGYMVYNPQKKTGVVILLNKSLGNERIRLGRNILKIF